MDRLPTAAVPSRNVALLVRPNAAAATSVSVRAGQLCVRMQKRLDLLREVRLILSLVAKINLMSRFRLLFAWLVLAALPLQGFAAASMLYCGMGPLHGAQEQTEVNGNAASDHDHATHTHTGVAKVEKTADSKSQLPDSSHKCGVCASCCNAVAITTTALPVAIASLPQTDAAEPFVLIHPRASPVPDKPPRA
jgi:hypothetical protein